jgi:hypothetical protein
VQGLSHKPHHQDADSAGRELQTLAIVIVAVIFPSPLQAHASNIVGRRQLVWVIAQASPPIGMIVRLRKSSHVIQPFIRSGCKWHIAPFTESNLKCRQISRTVGL